MRRIGAWLIGLAAFLVTLVTAMVTARKHGEAKERLKQAELGMRQARQGNEINDSVRDSTDADLDKRLSKYRRD